jgi:hypothetical protein
MFYFKINGCIKIIRWFGKQEPEEFFKRSSSICSCCLSVFGSICRKADYMREQVAKLLRYNKEL